MYLVPLAFLVTVVKKGTQQSVQGSYQNVLKTSVHSDWFPILKLLALLGS